MCNLHCITLFALVLNFFALVLHILHSFLSQSELSNFVMYIIIIVIVNVTIIVFIVCIIIVSTGSLSSTLLTNASFFLQFIWWEASSLTTTTTLLLRTTNTNCKLRYYLEVGMKRCQIMHCKQCVSVHVFSYRHHHHRH